MSSDEGNRFGTVIAMGIASFICLVVMIVGLVLYIIEVNKIDVKPILPPWASIKPNIK